MGRNTVPKRNVSILSLCIMVFVAFWPLRTSGQVLTAEILGTATDPSGAAVPGLKVTVVNLGTQETRSFTTNASGIYDVPLLLPGLYSVKAEHSGFRPWTAPSVTLAQGDKRRIDIHLQLASTTQQVTVVSETSGLQTQTATIASLVNSRAVEDLPLNGRNFAQLAIMAAGAHPSVPNAIMSGTRPDDRRDFTAVSINGMGDAYNNFLIDGMDNNEQIVGAIITKPSEEAIAEFKVQTNLYSAEFSKAGGGIISIATKSGTNQFHGSAFEYFRNDKLDAANFFLNAANKPKDELRQNQWGGSLGGPVLKDKLFFFGDFEQLNLRKGLPFSNSVPTAAERNGIFTGINRIFDPLSTTQDPTTGVYSRQEFPNDVIPDSAMSQVGKNLANLYPLPNAPGLANNYVVSQVLSQRDYKIDSRIDQRVSDLTTIFYRYELQDTNTVKPPQLGFTTLSGITGAVSPGGDSGQFAGSSRQRSQQAEVYLTHTFSPTFIVQALAGFSRLNMLTVGPNYGENLAEALGIPGVNWNTRTSGLSTIPVSGFTGLGDSQYIPLRDVNTDFQFMGSVNYIRGKHSLKIGGSIIHRDVVQPSSSATTGVFSFNPSFTNDPSGAVPNSGNSIASLLLGYPASTIRNFYLIVPSFRTDEIGTYVEDDWRATRHLTLNIGLRYDLFTPWTERHNQMACPDPGLGKILVIGQTGVNDHCNISMGEKNFAPRFGFAQTLPGHLVVRGGYGISYYSPLVGDLWLLRNPPYATITGISPSSLFVINRIDQGFGEPTPADPNNPTGDLRAPDFSLKLPSVQQYNLMLEQEIRPGWVWTVGYVGNLGRHEVANYNMNQPLPGPGAVQPRRPYYSVWPNVTSISTPYGRTSHYSALQASLEHRFGQGLTILFNYTYAHSIDTPGDTLGDGVDTASFPVLVNDLALSRGNSSYDVRHRTALLFTYALPFGQSLTGVERLLARDWHINTVFAAQTGMPFSVTNSPAQSNTGGGDMPNRICNGALSNPTVSEWFDTSCFVVQAPFTIGNSGRGILTAPGLVNWDFSLFKEFPLRESLKLQFRAEFFNFLNDVNLGYPNTSLGNVNFGRISDTANNTPRQIQFALKLLF
jgi:Carboxypeptidase regulatory-like domain/TonB dependent receptor-like, beta-barrel